VVLDRSYLQAVDLAEARKRSRWVGGLVGNGSWLGGWVGAASTQRVAAVLFGMVACGLAEARKRSRWSANLSPPLLLACGWRCCLLPAAHYFPACMLGIRLIAPELSSAASLKLTPHRHFAPPPGMQAPLRPVVR
jgi:hypothetical protein